MVSTFGDLSSMRGHLRSLLPGLKPGHAAVVELVIKDPLFVLDATAQQIAHCTQVSAATVVRAVRSAGYSGLPELKKTLAAVSRQSATPSAERSLAEATSPAQLTDVIITSHGESLRAAHGTLDQDAVAQAISTLRSTRRVLVTASGTSLPVATDAAYRMTISGLTAQHSADSYSSVLLAGLLGPEDALLAISHSGETPQTLQVVEEAQAGGATIIAITSYSQSTLARIADIPLVAVGSTSADHLVESSSRIAHLTVVDVLHSALALELPGRDPGSP